MTSKPFPTRSAAETAAALRPLAGAVWIGPVIAAALGIAIGWYVGFPHSVDKTLYGSDCK